MAIEDVYECHGGFKRKYHLIVALAYSYVVSGVIRALMVGVEYLYIN